MTGYGVRSLFYTELPGDPLLVLWWRSSALLSHGYLDVVISNHENSWHPHSSRCLLYRSLTPTWRRVRSACYQRQLANDRPLGFMERRQYSSQLHWRHNSTRWRSVRLLQQFTPSHGVTLLLSLCSYLYLVTEHYTHTAHLLFQSSAYAQIVSLAAPRRTRCRSA